MKALLLLFGAILATGCDTKCAGSVREADSFSYACVGGADPTLEMSSGRTYVVCRCNSSPDAGETDLDRRLDQHIEELRRTVEHLSVTVDNFVGTDGGK